MDGEANVHPGDMAIGKDVGAIIDLKAVQIRLDGTDHGPWWGLWAREHKIDRIATSSRRFSRCHGKHPSKVVIS